MEGWVDLDGWLHTEMVYPPRRSPIQVLTGPGIRKVTTLIETNALQSTAKPRHHILKYTTGTGVNWTSLSGAT